MDCTYIVWHLYRNYITKWIRLCAMLYLNGPVLSNQLVLHFITPQSSFCEVFQQVRIHYLRSRKIYSATLSCRDTQLWRYSCHILFMHADLKLSWEHPASVDVAGVGLNGLVVTQDLGSWSCGHGGQEQTVPYTMSEDMPETERVWIRDELQSPHILDKKMRNVNNKKDTQEDLLGNFFFQCFPVPQICWSLTPHVILKDLKQKKLWWAQTDQLQPRIQLELMETTHPLADRRANIGFISTKLCSKLTAGL